jgi:hypothetical protein
MAGKNKPRIPTGKECVEAAKALFGRDPESPTKDAMVLQAAFGMSVAAQNRAALNEIRLRNARKPSQTGGKTG